MSGASLSTGSPDRARAIPLLTLLGNASPPTLLCPAALITTSDLRASSRWPAGTGSVEPRARRSPDLSDAADARLVEPQALERQQ